MSTNSSTSASTKITAAVIVPAAEALWRSAAAESVRGLEVSLPGSAWVGSSMREIRLSELAGESCEVNISAFSIA